MSGDDDYYCHRISSKASPLEMIRTKYRLLGGYTPENEVENDWTKSADVSIRSDPGRVRDRRSCPRSYMDNLNPAIQICRVAIPVSWGSVLSGVVDLASPPPLPPPLACDP